MSRLKSYSLSTAARWVGLSVLLALASSQAVPQALPEAAPVPAPAANAALANTPEDQRLLDAREAWRKRDRARLQQARELLLAARHPLAPWADYWELNSRLNLAQQAELDAFYARWPGSYVEDRCVNDWLLELGRRRDWAHFC